MIKHIIREIAPEWTEFDNYFDGDTFTERAGDYCYTLFIVGDRHTEVFNAEAWEDAQKKAAELCEMFDDIQNNGYYSAWYSSFKACMIDNHIPYNSRKCHALKELFLGQKCGDYFNQDRPEHMAAYLSIVTNRKWNVLGVCGYSQGDYVQVVYCEGFNTKEAARECGELWMGCGKEFTVIDVENYAEDEDGEPEYTEVDSCGGYFVADCQAWTDEDYKRLVCEWAGINEEETRLEMIDGSTTQTIYSYRVA